MREVNQKRVESLLAGLARFGAGPKGITRLGYSAEDGAAQQWLLEQVADLGLELRQDVVGNVFLRRQGKQPQLAPVATGSHLDTVINGGAYDGMCGVVAGLEALYMLQDEELERSVEIIIFRCEESSRYGYATIGSKLLTGKGTPTSLDGHVRPGPSLEEAIRSWGGCPEAYEQAILPPGCYASFAELHIEQGRVLESLGKDVGIVEHIAAPTRCKIHLQGLADHSGATPMGLRRDALVTAAKLILAVEEAARAESSQGTVGTVGMVELQPNSMNVIPGEVSLWLDIRGVDMASITRTIEKIHAQAQTLAEADGIGLTWEELTADSPVELDTGLADKLEAICRNQGISWQRMPSGAGHDAMHMAALIPTTMIFVPCRQGISHNKAEFASMEAISKGILVLAELLKEEAMQVK